MKPISRALPFVAALSAALFLLDAAPVFARQKSNLQVALPPATNAIDSQKTQWFDAKRSRAVPAILYFPRAVAGQKTGPFPLLIISHGLGSNREGLNYVGKFWAGRGYICAQIQHIDSDESVWKNSGNPIQGLASAAANPKAINNRPLDVKFAIDTMLKLNKNPQSPLFGRINPAKIGVAGHSFGAFTAQAAAGRGASEKPSWPDARIKACVAMSAPSGPIAAIRPQFKGFKTPFFFLTGTNDDVPFVKPASTPATRRAAFDSISGVDGYYLLLKGADHFSFAGTRLFGDAPGDALDHDLVRLSTLLFFDAYLKGSASAKRELRDGGFAREMGAHGTLEVK